MSVPVVTVRPFTIFRKGGSMGASGWDYITRYDGDVEAALGTLQARVFQEEYGDGDRYRSLQDLYADEEFMGTEGTHTILDIDRVVATDDPPTQSGIADYGTLRPLALAAWCTTSVPAARRSSSTKNSLPLPMRLRAMRSTSGAFSASVRCDGPATTSSSTPMTGRLTWESSASPQTRTTRCGAPRLVGGDGRQRRRPTGPLSVAIQV